MSCFQMYVSPLLTQNYCQRFIRVNLTQNPRIRVSLNPVIRVEVPYNAPHPSVLTLKAYRCEVPLSLSLLAL